MKEGEIYRFDDPRDIFTHVYHEKSKHHPLFSIRAWSKKLGFRNPSHVAEILKGRRKISVDFGLRVSDSLGLSDPEKMYFESLVFLSNAKNDTETEYFSSVINKLRPEDGKKAIAPDEYAIIRDWYYGVLDEMTCLADFRPDPQYLAKRLGPNVTPQAIAVALSDLIRIGSIEKSPKGRLSRPRKVYFKTKDNDEEMEDVALRTYQRKFFERALLALDEQNKGESFFRVTNIPVKKKNLKEFRDQMEEFVQNMGKHESAKEADEVYMLGVQFCRITRKVGAGESQ